MTEEYNAQALEIAKAGARLIRNDRLNATDRHVLPDSPLSAADLKRVKAYRKWLRDLPATMTDDDFMTFKGVPSLDEWEIPQEDKPA